MRLLPAHARYLLAGTLILTLIRIAVPNAALAVPVDENFDQVARIVALGGTVTQVGGGNPGAALANAGQFTPPVNTQSGVVVTLPNYVFASSVAAFDDGGTGNPANTADQALGTPTDLTFTLPGAGGPDGGPDEGTVEILPGGALTVAFPLNVTAGTGVVNDLFIMTGAGVTTAHRVHVQILDPTLTQVLSADFPVPRLNVPGSGIGGIIIDIPDGLVFGGVIITPVDAPFQVDAVAAAVVASLGCGNGVLDPGEQCDAGGSATSCCSPTCQFVTGGTVCRPSMGACDLPSICSGVDDVCAPNPPAPAGGVCRASAGTCDLPETCDGLSNACPADVVEPAGLECRPSAGVCDSAEVCDGASALCPTDIVATPGTVCRDSLGPCDPAEACTGASGVCPVDTLLPAGATCRGIAGACDVIEVCSGVSAVCPTDSVLTAGVECRGPAGACDQAEACNGSNPMCPTDILLPPGSECRAAAGLCDAPEICDGISLSCPADVIASAGTVCRPLAGNCDSEELCNGVSVQCPLDIVSPSGALCRASGGECDFPESCDGVDGACPVDLKSTALCRASTDLCDAPESCDGVADVCPVDSLEPAGTECRSPVGACDAAELCDGATASCPADAIADAGTICRPALDLCDVDETCDGAVIDCPADVVSDAGTVCRPSADVCDIEEVCDGAAGVCPGDLLADDGSSCDEDACTNDQCVDGICETTPKTPDMLPPADFIFVIDSSATMRNDFEKWLPQQLMTFPAALEGVGIDYRFALIRFGTNRKGNRRFGPDVPDVVIPCTADMQEFADALTEMTQGIPSNCDTDPNSPFFENCIRRFTESGTEAINLALEDPATLNCRDNAIRNIILYTDEDDDSPALNALGQLNLEKREPPGQGIGCYGRSCESRWQPFQDRLDETAALMISQQVQLNVIEKSRNKPVRSQYGDPNCTALDSSNRLDPVATVNCLLGPQKRRGVSAAGICSGGGACTQGRVGQPCAVDADCNAYSLQLHLLTSGVCDVPNGVCSGGRIGAPCDDDFQCGILARAYEIPKTANQANRFFQEELIPDKIREQICPVAPMAPMNP